MARGAGNGARARRAGARPLPAREADRQGAALGRAHPVQPEHRLHQHHPAADGGALAGRRGARGAHPLLLPVERHDHGRAREQGRRRPRRAHRELRLARDADRHRAAPFLARADRRPRRRPDLPPGPFRARRLRADDARGAAHRGAGAQLPPRGRRQGHLLVSAPVADARRLAVPDRVDGAGADPGDLPGALSQVPARARPREHRGPQGVGVPRRRRDRRARVARRDRHGLAREARQPDLRHQLQPAAPRRPGARLGQDHPGARGRVPRRRLERDQARVGLVLGSAARARQGEHPPAGDGGDGRRRVPELQGERRRVRPQALLRQASEAARDGFAPHRRGHLAPEPRRPRPAQDLRRLPPRGESQGPADGDPRQDDQGLRHGPDRGRPDDRAPAEEDGHGVHQAVPRPLQHPGPRRQDRGAAVLHPAARRAGDEVPARAPAGARRLPAAAPPQGRRGAAGAGARSVRAGAEGPGARDLDDDGVRARADRARARQEPRQIRGADRPRRGAHVRHGGHVPAARHLLVRGPEVHAAGQGPGDVLPRGQGRPDPRGGHQRGGRVQLVDRRGDELQRVERRDRAVLHLLLDVRPAADRRSRLGGRRPARAGLPARRHRGPHDAERRRAAARGRPQPHPVVGDPELRLLRPDLRLRGRRHHPRRPAADGDEPGGRLLLPHRDERELRASGADRRRRQGRRRRAS